MQGDQNRIEQVLLSVLQNAVHEARTETVIKLDIWVKSISDKNIFTGRP